MFTRPQACCAAAGERDLELAAEILRVGMAEQKAHGRLRVGRDVERLVAAHAGERAGGDVAHRVAAGFARRDADRGQAPHDVRRVLDVDEVELEVLARGDVADAVGVLLGEVGEDVDLLRRQAAEGDLDALHAGRVPERLGALDQRAGRDTSASASSRRRGAGRCRSAGRRRRGAGASRRRPSRRLLPCFLQLDLRLEDVDLACPVGRHAVGQLVSPRRGHSAIPSIVAAAARENGAPSRAALERSHGAYLLPSRADHTTQGGRMLELGDPE